MTSQLDHLGGVLATLREPATRPCVRGIRPPGIVVHHSAGRSTATVDEIRRVHQVERGWADVGYHHLVREYAAGEWRAEPGRDEEYVGAHAPTRNDWIGVCVLGDYEAHPVPKGALEALVACCADVCERLSIKPAMIRPHRETGCSGGGATDCPGKHLIALLPAIRDDVAALLEAA